MVYIHGGSYTLGSGNDDLYGPDFLLEQGVIVVTLNYRLGVFGFINLGTQVYSGNMGLKDQQLAIKWVFDNIEHFSGDNKRITIFGESAGGSSVHFQVLSSESRKYFRNAIAMSGITKNLWAYSENEVPLNFAYGIADDLNAPQDSSQGLIELMKLIPAQILTLYGEQLTLYKRTVILELTPIIESK